MNKREIESTRKKLLAEKEQLQKQLRDLEEKGLQTSQSEETGDVGFDEEYAGSGSITFEREKDLSIHNNVLDLLAKVNLALEKLEKGTYGICENCGQKIMDARLKALPYATLCIDCKQKEEKMPR
ncbi:MAG: TraR/DksA family transcriptional regulator [Candidatus Geothermincolia bacterium]